MFSYCLLLALFYVDFCVHPLVASSSGQQEDHARTVRKAVDTIIASTNRASSRWGGFVYESRPMQRGLAGAEFGQSLLYMVI